MQRALVTENYQTKMESLFFFGGKKGELLLVFTDSISGDSSAQLY